MQISVFFLMNVYAFTFLFPVNKKVYTVPVTQTCKWMLFTIQIVSEINEIKSNE